MEPMSALLPWLVVLSTLALSLEILQRLLAARVLAGAVMLAAWGWLLPSELQLQAVCCAVLYHGVAESVRQWQQNFPCVFDQRKTRKVVLWLLFWARVFVWGATLGGAAVAIHVQHAASASSSVRPASGNGDDDAQATPWRVAALLAVYCEVMEVLLLLYFADEELPYLWRRRVGHWAAALLTGFLQGSGRLQAFTRGPVLAGMSPLALAVVLLLVMWLSIQIPWHEIAAASSTLPVDAMDKNAGDGGYTPGYTTLAATRLTQQFNVLDDNDSKNSHDRQRKPQLFVETQHRDVYFQA